MFSIVNIIFIYLFITLVVSEDTCSSTSYCPDGSHCCTESTCCPDHLVCCGNGYYCCNSNSYLESTNLNKNYDYTPSNSDINKFYQSNIPSQTHMEMKDLRNLMNTDVPNIGQSLTPSNKIYKFYSVNVPGPNGMNDITNLLNSDAKTGPSLGLNISPDNNFDLPRKKIYKFYYADFPKNQDGINFRSSPFRTGSSMDIRK